MPSRRAVVARRLQKLAEDFEEASNELMIADEEQVRVLLAGSALHRSLVTQATRAVVWL